MLLWLLWHVDIHFDWAGSHKVCAAVEILSRRSCQETSSREPGQRFHKEILYRDIAWRSFEILLAGLLQRSCQETSYRDLVHRSCQDTSYGDLVQRHCVEILLQRSCQEVSYINLAKRDFIESLCRDLKKRSCQEISYRDLVQEVLPRDLF